MCLGLLQGKFQLAGIHVAVEPVGCQGFIVSILQLLHAPVLGGAAVGQGNQALLIVQFHILQGLLGLLEFIALVGLQDKEGIPCRHLLAHLDHHGTNFPGLGQGHIIALVGGHLACPANPGVDGAGGDILGRHLRQRAVHNRIGEEGQHQQHGQKHNGSGFDPFSSFCLLLFHGIALSFSR